MIAIDQTVTEEFLVHVVENLLALDRSEFDPEILE